VPYSRLVITETRLERLRKRERLLRAAWRNARVIWREFRQPIVIFALAIFGGGWLYGELSARAGYERLPYVDLPYTMLALMLLEAPTEMPTEWHLVAFWYALPIVAAYVAGRGVVDFVRLFFNSGERHSDWEEAVASTYREHIIVLGVGHLGLRVIRALVSMGFEVVAIDNKTDPEKEKEMSRLRVPLVVSDGRLPATLEAAGIRHAESLIVCTSNDYMNLEVTMRARDLNPNLRIVVRMWEDQFADQIRRFMNVQAVMSATDLAAPSFAAAATGIEITQTLTVDGTDYSMIRLQVTPGSFLDGVTVGELQGSYEMDIVLHSSPDGSVQVHPAHVTEVRAGDTLVIFAQHTKITDVVSRNHKRH